MQLRALQLQHPALVASHRSAAALHRIELTTYAVEVTDPALSLSRLLDYTVYRLPLPEADIVTIDGIRVTTALRTLTDLQRALPLDEAVMATDCALHRRLVDRQQLIAALQATASRRNTATALRCLALADPRCESPAETRARLRMHDAGLHPESQARVTTAQGRTRRLDFLFRAEGLAVEIEGHKWHGTRAQHQNDVIRFNKLSACPGVRQLLRFTANDVLHRPQYVIRTIEQALAQLKSGV
jgi:very-short-patch-repair endonuclease